MQADLAGHQEGHAERFSVEQHGGRLIEAEHRTRYRWAAQAVHGKSVLDAGCGTAYGCRELAEAGARAVVGVDIAQAVLDAVAPEMPEGVTLQAEDLRALSFPDDRFEAIVCFEVLEHFTDPFEVLDELARVLAPGGILLVSSPNRGVFPGGNPHHHHEFRPEELHHALAERFGHVALTRQQVFMLSAALGDQDFRADAGAFLSQLTIEKMVPDAADSELYTLAAASDADLPELGQVAAMTGSLDYRDWLERFNRLQDTVRAHEATIDQLETTVDRQGELTVLLDAAEQQLAVIPAMEQKIELLLAQIGAGYRAAEATREEIRDLESRLTDASQIIADLTGSPSWKITRPLRDAKRLLGR